MENFLSLHPNFRPYFTPPPISIPQRPSYLTIKEEYEMAKSRLVYLETLECRAKMSKEEIDQDRKTTTEKFKNLIKLLAE